MSTPPSAEKKTVPEPLVTPAADAHYDCSSNGHRKDCQDHVHQAPSPSRAESPSARQWAMPPSSSSPPSSSVVPGSFPLKKNPKAPFDVERLAPPYRSHTPQLSERDSIFATNYLPSDTESHPLPSHSPPPLEPSNNAGAHTISLNAGGCQDAPATLSGSTITSKVLPHRPRGEAVHMEVDVHRTPPACPPLRPPFSLPSVTTHNALLSATGTEGQQHGDLNDPVADNQTLPTPTQEKPGTMSAPPEEDSSAVNRSLIPSAITPPLSLPAADQDTSLSQDPGDVLRDGGRDMVHHKGERSSSRNRRGRVESSIEANLTNTEPASNVRSRKSSHYLGLFKENTTSPERKRREDGDRKPEEPWSPSDESSLHVNGAGVRRSSKSRSYPSFSDAPMTIEPTSGTNTHPQAQTDDLVKYQYRALPHSLLEEIRNFHLTPGGARGTSFSKSIPTQYSERSHDYAREHELLGADSPSFEVLSEQDQVSGQYADEEENEQISSALYFPHERVTVSEEVDPYGSQAPEQESMKPYEIPTEEVGPVLLSGKEQDLPGEQEVSHVDISLRSKNDSRVLHGDLQDLQAPLEEPNDKPLTTISERSYDSTCESELPSADETGSTHEESSLTEDDGAELTTPTATPTQRNRYLRHGRKHGKAAPVGAVELKPYRHQVGGHTTVFRFSRRAVCKQLNNRENQFYERIERRHPEMLMFLPRYIGVLNVTFSKNPKRSQSQSRPADHIENTDAKPAEAVTDGAQPPDAVEQPRIFSQSQKQVPGITPKVILENNRHIIPADLFSRHQRPRTADGATMSNKNRFPTGDDVSDQPKPSNNGVGKQKLLDKPIPKSPNVSWGATTVNWKLQEQVLREVFSPPAIHHHRRHARGRFALPRIASDSGRRRGNLSEDHTASSRHAAPEPNEPARSHAVDIAAKPDEGPALSSSASTALDAPHSRLDQIRAEETEPRTSSLHRHHNRHVRRRHSGSGLQRRGSLESSKRGDLVFFDDDGYGGDQEDEIFAMEPDAPTASGRPAAKPSRPSAPEVDVGGSDLPPAEPTMPTKSPVRPGTKGNDHFYLPTNPKEAQTRKDDRVQYFLLLEDLTAGMTKPCVLDLKMGTRQYGIEANDKKRKSQRRKCQSTTSQQLGVRLCGMQSWNVKKQGYTFEDKYFGRDLRSGREFQNALTRFLYDGVSYTSVVKRIPLILEKLSTLENMIRKLKSYRLYASSLLILYDGEQAPPDTAPNTDPHKSGNKQAASNRASDEGHNNLNVQLKIVDFANCVTGEDELPPTTPCPPQYPQDIDRGYLRGLRTLKTYFKRIMKEVSHDDYIERGENEAVALGTRTSGHEDTSERYWDDELMENDPGEVSY